MPWGGFRAHARWRPEARFRHPKAAPPVFVCLLRPFGVVFAGLSDAPEKRHPWSKYYSERGVPRPPMAVLRKPEPDEKPPAVKPGAGRSEQPPISDALAAAVAAATAGMPGSTAAPFITIMQREAVARELRRQNRVRWARRGVAALVGFGLLHLAVTRVLYRSPSDAALRAYADDLTRVVTPLHSSPLQPLVSSAATTTLTDRISASRIRYAAEVTLRLAQPLYVPATSNGTADYRLMQQSLTAAREKELKFKLFDGKEGPEAPKMPLLLQVAHRAGEPVIVRVPFEAKRFGWNWRIEPAQLALRTVNRWFDGTTIDRYANTPHLIFGAPGTLADMRLRTRLARNYIVAVTREVQKRADREAIEAPLDSALADAPALDPNAPASTDRPAGAPAMPATPLDPDAPAVDPDAPAVDPNAPAVKEPRPTP